MSSKINLDKIYENNVGTLVKLASTVLPAKYPDSFFDEIFHREKGTFFAQLAYYNEIAVGAVKAKLLPKTEMSSVLSKGVYIEVLGVLSPYRNKSVGAKLLEYVEQQCQNHYQHDIYVHVATDNQPAIDWYQKHGFKQEGDTLEGYYRNTKGSSSAYILKKHLP